VSRSRSGEQEQGALQPLGRAGGMRMHRRTRTRDRGRGRGRVKRRRGRGRGCGRGGVGAGTVRARAWVDGWPGDGKESKRKTSPNEVPKYVLVIRP
jgi:hypothetical protein